jgi:hypothetical protein
MASTRAAGRALRLAVGHLFAGLGAGVQSVTAEEMPEVEYQPAKAPTPAKGPTPVSTVFPPPEETGGRFTGTLAKVWAPKPGTKRIGFEVETEYGMVKLGSFTAHHLEDAQALQGSEVEVAWKRSKCGKYLNVEGILGIGRRLPPPPANDPDADIPF